MLGVMIAGQSVILFHRTKAQCDGQENRNRIWIKTGPITLQFDISDSSF